MGVEDAMIVAGGRGTRLQPLTYTCPKPLLPFCGEPLLTGVIRRLAATGIERVFLIVGADTQPFEVLREDADEHGITVEMVPEPEPLDTAGGVRAAVEDVDGTVLVLNGDVLTDLDYGAAVAHHERAGPQATLALTRVEDTSSYGVCVREGTKIVDFVEKPAPGTLPGQDAINAGSYVLEADVLRSFPTGRLSFERDVFPGIVEDGGHLEGFVWDGVWQDLGTPGRWRAGHRLALDGELDWPTLAAPDADRDGVRVAGGAAVDARAVLQAPVLVLDGARLRPEAEVGPHAVVGREGELGRGVRLRDSVLFDGVEIGAGVEARGLIAGRGARIHEGARVGDGVVLGDGQTITGGTVLEDGQRVPPRRD